MIRNAFKMQLKPGFEEEYKKRHDEIWPELSKLLTDVGVSNYSIFLDPETLVLYGYQELTDDNTSDDLPKLDIMKKWWAHMKDIMDSNPDNSPIVKPLNLVFHMD